MERFVDSEERSVLDLPIWMLLVLASDMQSRSLASDMQSSSATEDAKILIRGSVNMRMINEVKPGAEQNFGRYAPTQ